MWEVIRANRRRTVVLLLAMGALLIGCGYALGELIVPGAGPTGVALSSVAWASLGLTSYFAGDRLLLASNRARRIEKADHPVLWNVVEEMCIASGLSTMPAVYIIDEDAPNAFATGRDPEHASVAVTAGLLEKLTRDELQGVVAHEIGHVNNRDILYLMVASVMLGTVVMIADTGMRTRRLGGYRRTSAGRDAGAQNLVMIATLALAILAPLVARLMYLALSRRREYLADASSALYTRYPEGLASALEKIAGDATPLQVAGRVSAPMYIVNPLAAAGRGGIGARAGGGVGGSIGARVGRRIRLTSTHPPTEERVRILRGLGGDVSFAGYDDVFRQVTGRAVGVVPAGAVATARPVRAHAPQPDSGGHVRRVRDATDALWRLQDYEFTECACGVSMKMPTGRAPASVRCPRCGSVTQPSGETSRVNR